MRKASLLPTALLAAFGLLTGACGGDDDAGGGDGGALVDALAAEVEAEEGSPVNEPEDARCFAAGVVDRIGEERLNELGVTVESIPEIEEVAFTDAEFGEVVAAMSDCVDLTAGLTEALTASLGAEGAACVAEGLDADALADFMQLSLAGDEPDQNSEVFQQFIALTTECGLGG